MDRAEFLGKLVKLYPKSFTEDNAQEWVDAYQMVLYKNIDYTNVLRTMLREYTGNIYAPSASYLVELARSQKDREEEERMFPSE